MTDLLTVSDIAALLRASLRTVADRWVHRPDFPAPHLAPSPRHRLWRREDIIAWAQRGAASQRLRRPSPCNTP